MKPKSKRVKFEGIHPAMVPFMFRADEIVRKHLGYEMIITSCLDGKHSETSKHYLGCAWDIRTWKRENGRGQQIPWDKKLALADELNKEIPEMQFIAEASHIHGEYEIRYSKMK